MPVTPGRGEASGEVEVDADVVSGGGGMGWLLGFGGSGGWLWGRGGMKLPRERRMTSSGEFRRVKRDGRSMAGAHLVMAVCEDVEGRLGGGFKVGFVTSRRVGGAVVRNRVRRRLRAVVREVGGRVRPGVYVVTIARARAAGAAYAKLRNEWCWLAKKLGVFGVVGGRAER